MKDIEPDVFDEFCAYMHTQYPTMDIRNEILMTPETFPMVCLEEITNTIDRSTIDSSHNENYENVDYETRVYVHPVFGKRREAKEIMSYADSWFTNKGFERINSSFTFFNDGTKAQCINQYQAKTDGNTIYRR